MRKSYLVWTAVILFWLSAGLEQGASGRLAIFGAQPNFLLVSLSVVGLYCSRQGALALGFFAGLLEGSLIGANTWQLVLARMIGGLVMGWIAEQRFQKNSAIFAASTMGVVLISELVRLFVAPPPQVGPFLAATIIGALYNGVLAILISVPVRKILGSQTR